MNVAKNWALTIMLIALAFAHFSSELLLKEQMIISVKKIVKQRWSYQRKIDRFFPNLPKKPQRNRLFLLIVSWRSFPRNFPWNRPIFLRICPGKSFVIWLSRENLAKSADFSTNFEFFSAKIPRNRPIFLRILTFLPRKSHEIGRFFREFAPENPAKFCSFFREISEALFIHLGHREKWDSEGISGHCWPG